MQDYVVKNQKKLRCGLTTGTCAAAAAAAAAQAFLMGEEPEQMTVFLPDGQRKTLPVRKADGCPGAEFYVIKDAGDDPDVTDGAEIHARIDWADPEDARKGFSDEGSPELHLYGGAGVGIVTKEGLEQEPGMPAINRVPREMIFRSVRQILETAEPERGLAVTISVPGGEKMAERTFNPMLGIRGGISILGTSGIVEPMSERSVVDTIEVQIRQQKNLGRDLLVLVPGNMGQRYVREKMGLERIPVIQCSNYIGQSLDLCAGYEMSRVLIVGNIGKMVKLAAGIMETHSRTADGRWEIMAAHAALCGASSEQLQVLRESVTTEQMLEHLEKWGLRQAVTDRILSEIERHLTRRAGPRMKAGATVYSEKYGFLGRTETAGEILEEIHSRETGTEEEQ